MVTVKVRPAKIEDAPEIARIHVQTWQCAYRGQIPDSYLDNLSVEKKTKHWQETLSKSTVTKTFVAEIDGQVIGFCILGPSRDEDADKTTGELGAIYIDQNHMGQGAGSALLKEGIDYFKEQGFTKATLWVLDSNEKTIKWYESKGWKREGKTKTDSREGFDLKETRYITVFGEQRR